MALFGFLRILKQPLAQVGDYWAAWNDDADPVELWNVGLWDKLYSHAGQLQHQHRPFKTSPRLASALREQICSNRVQSADADTGILGQRLDQRHRGKIAMCKTWAIAVSIAKRWEDFLPVLKGVLGEP